MIEGPYGNRLLDALGGDATSLLRRAERVRLKRGDTTTVHDRVMRHVDFPTTALMSVNGSLEDGTVYEVASVGSEGFVEIDAALESDVALRNAVCQFEGEAMRVPLGDFTAALHSSRRFAVLARHAVRARVFITEQTVMCNAKHQIVRRLARWLLLAYDRLERRDFDVTHEFLATILGVRRAGVSSAAAGLEAQGAIAQYRGLVAIRDTAALASAACECYGLCREALGESLGSAIER